MDIIADKIGKGCSEEEGGEFRGSLSSAMCCVTVIPGSLIYRLIYENENNISRQRLLRIHPSLGETR
jgi:hypothetical protein